MEPVYVIGAGRTDFKRNLRKEGKTLRHIILEAGRAAVTDAGIAVSDIQGGIIGNFASGLFTRQLHLGAMLTELDESLRGMPTWHVEAACASGGLAILTAAQQIMGGLRDVMIVVGAEQQKTMSPAEGADVLGAAGDFHSEKPKYVDLIFPRLFADIAGMYQQKYGLTEEQLTRVAAKNYANARRNPLAQMREAAFPPAENPVIAAPLRLSDCSQISDGGASVVLCSERFLKKLGKHKAMKLSGYGHTSDHLALADKPAPDFPIARKAVDQAFEMSGMRLEEMDGIEVHDCFSISEILAYEVIGLAKPGQGAKYLEEHDGSFINAGGGLIADGHPVGATGVRQVGEAFLQLTGGAGARQIADAQRYLTYNIGGTYGTNVVMIWLRED